MNPISTFTKHTQADVMHINSTVLSCWQCVVHYMYTMERGIGFESRSPLVMHLVLVPSVLVTKFVILR